MSNFAFAKITSLSLRLSNNQSRACSVFSQHHSSSAVANEKQNGLSPPRRSRPVVSVSNDTGPGGNCSGSRSKPLPLEVVVNNELGNRFVWLTGPHVRFGYEAH